MASESLSASNAFLPSHDAESIPTTSLALICDGQCSDQQLQSWLRAFSAATAGSHGRLRVLGVRVEWLGDRCEAQRFWHAQHDAARLVATPTTFHSAILSDAVAAHDNDAVSRLSEANIYVLNARAANFRAVWPTAGQSTSPMPAIMRFHVVARQLESFGVLSDDFATATVIFAAGRQAAVLRC